MKQKKILLADDDAEDREIIVEALQSLTDEDLISFAENGPEAIRKLETFFETDDLPCLIVLDLNMPLLTGTQTLQHIKSDPRFKEIPVIIYSTSINPFEKQKCISLGAHSYVIKPISVADALKTANIFLSFCIE